MTLWTVALQAPLSMGFSRQEYRSGLPFFSPEDFPDPGAKPTSPAWKADSLLLSHRSRFGLSQYYCQKQDPLDSMGRGFLLPQRYSGHSAKHLDPERIP